MATRMAPEPLPLGVGRITRGWLVVTAAALAVLGFGLYAYSRQLSEGEIVTGLRSIGTMGGATWGLYIAFVVYFVGISFAGITIAALIRLADLTHLRPLARMAELLTIVALPLAGLAILADLGQPLRGLVNLFRYARPQSPFFGTFTLVIAGYLFASLVFFYLESRRDAAVMARIPSRMQWLHRGWAAGWDDTQVERDRQRRASFWLAIAILPLLVVAHSTLGFVFGLQSARPGWFSALQAPGFVVLAGVSGIGMVIVLAAVVRQDLHQQEALDERVFAWLGRLLLILTVVYLYFMVTELLTATYTGDHHEVGAAKEILSGSYAWVFWASSALFVIPAAVLAWQALTRRWYLPLLVASGLMVNLAAIGKRFLIVVPSQTSATLLPYSDGSYSPSWVEIAVVGGLFALGVTLIAGFMKVFPIMEIEEAATSEEVAADA